MGAIGLNPIRLDRIGLDPIRINAIKLGVPGASGTDRPYIDPEVLASLKAVCICYGKSNDDPDRAVVKNLVDPDNPFVISNAAYTEGSGYADKDSPYYGAFVTDGIDDLITSTKTVQEMLGGSNEITVVSMIHQIELNSTHSKGFTNYIETIDSSTSYVRTQSNVAGKTGIYGYTYNNTTQLLINNILGDKNDYEKSLANATNILSNSRFSVAGGINNTNTSSSVAWYWTIIANKVLTTDQINQVIAYFNLDRTLKPDILCNTIKQGITNENHAEFGDKLIDFSGNGRDIQLNNIAWNKESGIDDDGALRLDGVNDFGKVTGMPIYKDYTVIADYERFYLEPITGGRASILSKSSKVGDGSFIFNLEDQDGGKACYTFGEANGNISDDITRIIRYQSKYYNTKTLSIGTAEDNDFMVLGKVREVDSRYFCGAIYSLMTFPYSMSEFLIERQLKKHKLGTLYPDMVEFRPIINGKTDLIKEIKWFSNSWSKRIYPGDYITKGVDVTATILLNYNGLKLTKASYGNEYTEVRKQANWSETNNIWDLIIHNIGKSPQKIDITIEQDENYVQWNPVVESNAEYSDIAYLNYSHNIATINVGDYINVGDTVGIRVILNSTIDEVVNCKVNGQECEIVNVSPRVFDCKFTLTSESPQKINITIYQPPEYLTMLSNSTLISNETLIKNE